ncbi:MAG: hypothetical protein QOI69_2436, partial [Pseudonocardiales bacterium]|nr:hypothetical protein [Pseudonocardiales bacterium]
ARDAREQVTGADLAAAGGDTADGDVRTDNRAAAQRRQLAQCDGRDVLGAGQRDKRNRSGWHVSRRYLVPSAG